MESQISLQFELSGDNSMEANQLAASLKEALNESSENIEVSRMREPGSDHQDLGTVIVAILATKAAVEVAKGLRAWLMKNPDATLTVKKTGEVTVTGAKARDLLPLLDRILPPKV